MKDKLRWQPEEDALLKAYVKDYGTSEWHLVSERLGGQLDRDSKSCEERWKNHLKPGIKRGPLSDEEQNLVIQLQGKYGNKWKRIAAEVPGRTAKRLGKWWEVYKERKQKEMKRLMQNQNAASAGCESLQLPRLAAAASFAPSSVVPPAPAFSTNTGLNGPGCSTCSGSEDGSESDLPRTCCQQPRSFKRPTVKDGGPPVPEPVLTLGPTHDFLSTERGTPSKRKLPFDLLGSATEAGDKAVWIPASKPADDDSNTECTLALRDISPSELLLLMDELKATRDCLALQMRKNAVKLRELRQQLEAERMEKRKQKMEEVEAKVQALRKEEKLYLDKLELDYAELILNLDRDAEAQEAKLLDTWSSKYARLFECTVDRSPIHGPLYQAIQSGELNNSA